MHKLTESSGISAADLTLLKGCGASVFRLLVTVQWVSCAVGTVGLRERGMGILIFNQNTRHHSGHLCG